jgi:hypothetical protein
MHYMHETPTRYVPAKTNEGWGVAGLVTLLAIACIAWAAYEYNATYKHPTDARWHAAGQQTAPAVANH